MVENLKGRKDLLPGYRINIIVLIVMNMLFRCVSETVSILNEKSGNPIVVVIIIVVVFILIGLSALLFYNNLFTLYKNPP